MPEDLWILWWSGEYSEAPAGFRIYTSKERADEDSDLIDLSGRTWKVEQIPVYK